MPGRRLPLAAPGSLISRYAARAPTGHRPRVGRARSVAAQAQAPSWDAKCGPGVRRHSAWGSALASERAPALREVALSSPHQPLSLFDGPSAYPMPGRGEPPGGEPRPPAVVDALRGVTEQPPRTASPRNHTAGRPPSSGTIAAPSLPPREIDASRRSSQPRT